MGALLEVLAVLGFVYLLIGGACMLIDRSYNERMHGKSGAEWKFQILYKWPWILAGKETY